MTHRSYQRRMTVTSLPTTFDYPPDSAPSVFLVKDSPVTRLGDNSVWPFRSSWSKTAQLPDWETIRFGLSVLQVVEDGPTDWDKSLRDLLIDTIFTGFNFIIATML